MNKGIKARLYLPGECMNIIYNKKELLEKAFSNYKNLIYDIYLGEYNEKEICVIDIILLNETRDLVNDDYQSLKYVIKNFTGKQPKQLLKFSFERIS